MSNNNNRSLKAKRIVCGQPLFSLLIVLCSLFMCSCRYGELEGADQTDYSLPGEEIFEERLQFMDGIWYSRFAGIGRLDGYRIRRWGGMSDADRARAQSQFTELDIGGPKTYAAGDTPKDSDFVLLYDDTVYGQEDDGAPRAGGNWGFAYMGLVRKSN